MTDRLEVRLESTLVGTLTLVTGEGVNPHAFKALLPLGVEYATLPFGI